LKDNYSSESFVKKNTERNKKINDSESEIEDDLNSDQQDSISASSEESSF